MPSRKHAGARAAPAGQAAAPVRPLWSGTITFGLVSIPVDLMTAVRPRQTAMRLVDEDGHPLGREYRCSKDGQRLAQDELVRGYETDEGKIVVITDEEFEAAAPEMSGDIELRSFVPPEQIPPMYFQKPYFLAPAGKSAKAYHLLAATMARTQRVGIGSFVMRGHEYLAAIISDNGVLRADTLRYADELRTPEDIGLPKRAKVAASASRRFAAAIDDSVRTELDLSRLEDKEADALKQLAETKQNRHQDVISPRGLDAQDESDADGAGAQIIDLMAVLRKSLSKNAVVKTASSNEPISLAERRPGKPAQEPETKKRATRRAPAPRHAAARKRATRE